MQRILKFGFSQNVWYLMLLGLGIVMRLLWLSDMEWKADEQLMYNLSENAINSGSLPELGMPTGVGLPNAGFSIWPFIAFYFIHPSPVFMAFCVAAVNILALLLMWTCSHYCGSRIRIFQQAVALVAVNVIAVTFSRKLWAQDLLPLFTAGLWYLSLQKPSNIKWVLMGIVAMLAGQLHISGYYYSAGLISMLMIRGDLRKIGILYLAIGLILGFAPAIPWLIELMHSSATSNTHWWYIFRAEFFLHLVTDTLGINLNYSLGKDLMIMMKYTYYVPVLPAVLLIIGTTKSAYNWVVKRKETKQKISLNDPLVFYFLAFVIIPGLLLTASGTPVRSHYLIGTMPFAHAGLVWLWNHAGLTVKMIWMQCVITLIFLVFIHYNGAPNGDYGIPYSHQLLLHNQH